MKRPVPGRSARLLTGHHHRHVRLWRAATLTVLLACLVAMVSVPTAGADETVLDKSFTMDSMDVVLDVQENGDVIVDETMAVTFHGNYHFFARDIPTSSYGGISDIEVRDATGAAISEGNLLGTYDVEVQGDTTSIILSFDLTDTTGVWTFHYRAKEVVSFGPDDDALEWHVFDAVNPVAVGRSRATIKLPGSVDPAELLQKVNVDVGYGATSNVFSLGPSTLVFEASEIPAFAHFWVKCGFPKGVVKYHWTTRRVVEYILPKFGFLLPVIMFLTVLIIWMRVGRDPGAQVYAKYVDAPPSDLSPGLVGALIDEKVDTKEVIATIVDLARRGYLEMTDGKTVGKSGTIFTRLKPLDDLTGFEKTVAESLFDEGHPEQVTTSDLKNRFYVHVGPIVGQVYEAVTAAGLFRKNPKKTRSAWKIYGFLVLIGSVAVAFILSKADIAGYGWIAAGGIVSAIVMWIFSSRMPGRTAKGAQEQKKWEAFREYLKDLTRFQDMEAAQEKFESCLPYAIALGVEKQWTTRFEELTVPSPTWYHPPVVLDGSPGPVSTGMPGGGLGGGLGRGIPTSGGGGGGFSLDDVSDGLFGALGKMSSVLTSAPSSSGGGSSRGAWGGGGSSGGGGFGGGGFSGGGGGGGGFRAG